MKQELWLVIIECCVSSKETPQNLRRFLLYNAASWVGSARFVISISLFLVKNFLLDDFFVSSLYHLKNKLRNGTATQRHRIPFRH